MKWKVTVQRVEYRSAEFVVDADDADEAEDKGLEASCDHDFSVNTVDHAEEDVTSARSAAVEWDNPQDALDAGAFATMVERLLRGDARVVGNDERRWRRG